MKVTILYLQKKCHFMLIEIQSNAMFAGNKNKYQNAKMTKEVISAGFYHTKSNTNRLYLILCQNFDFGKVEMSITVVYTLHRGTKDHKSIRTTQHFSNFKTV